MVELSVILVNWNTREIVLQCLQSLYDNPPERPWDVFLVDNGSTDGSADAVSERFPEVHLIRNEQKRSFTEANNQAIEASKSRYLLILNVDTVVHAGALEATCAYLDEHPDVGAVGCRLLNSDGTLQRSAWRGYPGVQHALIEGFYLWKILPALVTQSEVTFLGTSEPIEVDHLLGAYILVPRRVIDQVGAFDTGYYLYMDETDLCQRIRVAGYKVIYLPGPTTVHLGQSTQRAYPAASLMLFYSSYCRFVRKTSTGNPQVRMFVFKCVIALSLLVRLGLWGVRYLRRPELSRGMLIGYGSVLQRLPSLTILFGIGLASLAELV